MMFAGMSLLNFVLSFSRACVAGNILNENINRGGPADDENGVTFWVVYSTLVVTMINCASCGAGLIHYTEATDGTRGTAVGAGAIVLFLEMLVMGLACKMWQIGPADGVDKLSTQTNFLGGAVITQVVLVTIYTLQAYVDWPTCYLRAGFRAAGKSVGAPEAAKPDLNLDITHDEEDQHV